MNATSRAILQTVLATAPALSVVDRNAAQRLIEGQVDVPGGVEGRVDDDLLLVTQKRAAELLSVSRATIWRMTRDRLLHPVEIIPIPVSGDHDPRPERRGRGIRFRRRARRNRCIT